VLVLQGHFPGQRDYAAENRPYTLMTQPAVDVASIFDVPGRFIPAKNMKIDLPFTAATAAAGGWSLWLWFSAPARAAVL
jgi:hypothetical protein